MKKAGIDRSVICSIATRIEQFTPILDWCRTIASSKIIPLPSIHPDDSDYAIRIPLIAREGFKGIKMHPYYQGFLLDDPRLFPLYDLMAQHSLFLVMHTGFDIGFPREEKAGPKQIMNVVRSFPDLKLITTHLGGWNQWDQVEKYILGQPVYMEISFALQFLPPARATRILSSHPEEYLLFGTDFPWDHQKKALHRLRQLQLGEKKEMMILHENGAQLLKM